MPRNLFAEITEGFDALAEERAGKPNHEVGARPLEAPAANVAPIVAVLLAL